MAPHCTDCTQAGLRGLVWYHVVHVQTAVSTLGHLPWHLLDSRLAGLLSQLRTCCSTGLEPPSLTSPRLAPAPPWDSSQASPPQNILSTFSPSTSAVPNSTSAIFKISLYIYIYIFFLPGIFLILFPMIFFISSLIYFQFSLMKCKFHEDKDLVSLVGYCITYWPGTRHIYAKKVCGMNKQRNPSPLTL